VLRTKSKTGQALTGKTLRWVACLVLRDAARALTVSEIVERVEALGYTIEGERAGKRVSDALRWEVGRGRVTQIGRDLYGSGIMQRSTEYSMRKRVEALRTPLVPAGGNLPFDGSIDLDHLDTSDAWSGPAPAVFVDDL
jgi:hypothetical protein